jgi:phenylalanyl-tRNA synthetase beta chain
MAGIKFSKKEFEKHIKLTEEIKEKISLFGTHFEGMSEDGNEIELEILPNRPDLFSLQTFAKSFNAFLGKGKGLREYKLNKPEKDFQVTIDASTKNVRPFTACAIIKDMKFDDEKIKEIVNIQEKIHMTLGRNRKKIAIGIYPLEKITLPIKLEARAPKDIKFIPLEMDREMNGLQILQSHPTGRDYAHLLEGRDKFPVFVDAKNEILSMPPIINSHKTGKITETTKDVFIECSGFDFDILKKTLNILAVMFAEMGGKIYQMELNYGKEKILTPDLTPEKMKLNLDNANKLLGLDLKETDAAKLLEKMGHNYDLKSKIVEVPAWRTDVMHEVDLIEDIAIAYGIDNFQPEIPSIATTGEISKTELLKKKLAEILCGLNMLEISTYYMLTKDDAKILGIKEKDSIEVEESKSEYKVLKPNLMVSNLKTLMKNIDSEYPQKIFELNKTFEKDSKEETGIKETEKLCISIASQNTGFTEIKQILQYLTRMISKDKEISLENGENAYFVDGRCAKIVFGKKTIGFMGEIKPQILENLGIKMPISALEIDIEGFL